MGCGRREQSHVKVEKMSDPAKIRLARGLCPDDCGMTDDDCKLSLSAHAGLTGPEFSRRGMTPVSVFEPSHTLVMGGGRRLSVSDIGSRQLNVERLR